MDQNLYDFHKEMQFDHWWFRGRAKVIRAFMDSFIKEDNLEILDIGSGFGALHPLLRKWGKVDALEPYSEAHEYLKVFNDGDIHTIGDFPDHYPPKQYDLVTLFDVLEHIEDDKKALTVVRDNLLGEKGRLVITVPAYQWLWTERDTLNRHFRRYDRKGLRKLLAEAGFGKIRISYFMTFLFPLALLQRILLKLTKSGEEDMRIRNRKMNFLFSRIFGAEAGCIRGMNFPFGLSLIAVAEK